MKFQFVRMAILIVVALFIAACSAMDQKGGDSAAAGGTDMAAFEKAYQAAEAAYKKVSALEGAGWRDTGDFLKEAKETAKTDIKKDISLAEYAKFESEAALAQFESQKNAGPYLF